MPKRIPLIVFAGFVIAAGAAGGEEAAESAAYFESQVRPVLAEHCLRCHGPEKQQSDFRLDTPDSFIKGGKRGTPVAAGDVEGSRLIQAVRQQGDLKMPPKGRLAPAEVAVLEEWVRTGAVWPADAKPIMPNTTLASEAAQFAKAERKVRLLNRPVVPANYTVEPGEVLSFNKDVRPILAETCLTCHGPDSHARKAGLRLDMEEGAKKELASGRHAVVPGDLKHSSLWQRITTADPEDRMPPDDFHKDLTLEHIETIGRWIVQGAKWEKHWAFVPVARPLTPATNDGGWARNPIDSFIFAKLAESGLQPSPEADRLTLLRRVTLDLTGLPPSLEDLEAIEQDSSPAAYENAVERLFSSPRHGEHLARLWLDGARFSDTNGYHIDNERFMWPWRDWLIRAFNENLPFDQFTIWQLAGDLLPNPSFDQLVATGFNRNHMINFEGGAIPEEYRTEYVRDRVNTTGTVWMGLTLNCAQCHDHKYDPVSMKEYYSLYSYFNNIEEQGLDGNVTGNSVPFIKAPTPEQAERIAAIRARITGLEEKMNRPVLFLDEARAHWERDLRARLEGRWQPLAVTGHAASGGSTLTRLEDGSYLAAGENPADETYEVMGTIPSGGITAIRLEALADASLPGGGAGRAHNANFVLSEFQAEVAPAGDAENFRLVPFVAAEADYAQENFPVALAIDGKPETGWAAEGQTFPEDRVAVFIPAEPAGFGSGTVVRIRLRHESPHKHHGIGRFRITVTADPGMALSALGPWHVSGPYQAADGREAFGTAYPPEQGIDLAAVYPDGRFQWVEARPELPDGAIHRLPGGVAATYLYRTIHAATDRILHLGLGSNDALKVWVNDEVVHEMNVPRPAKADEDKISVALRAGENRLLMKVVNYGSDYAFYFKRLGESVGEVPLDMEAILSRAPERRTEKQARMLRDFYRRERAPHWKEMEAEIKQAKAEESALEKEIPTTMVMKELPSPRDSFVLTRGQYDQPGEKVEPATPSVLPAAAPGAPRNRLGFAQWLVSREHPLTARVTVNRVWQRFFGTGIVKTAEDFGTQGEWPSHPELLDWLAAEFMESGWDLRALERMIVTSSAYRQSSRVSPDLYERDPENRLLARGPRFRMDAEMVRDNALAVSGLLVPKIGGPSVNPYQPPGLWEAVAYGGSFSAQRFVQSTGEGLYRRSMYTFWKRTSPPASMMIFDAPNRETCSVRRARSNTPLQALTLLNDPQYVEAARVLAQRVLREAPSTPEARVDHAFRLATARRPSERERAVLLRVYDTQLARFRGDAAAAEALITVGESEPDRGLDACELAAWATVANTILNLDETITKG